MYLNKMTKVTANVIHRRPDKCTIMLLSFNNCKNKIMQ